MAIDKCETPEQDPKRVFWTTQPGACGLYQDCREECNIPGLQYMDAPECGPQYSQCAPQFGGVECLPQNSGAIKGRTFATNDWVRGLLLNILNTDARLPPSACGVPPGTQGGHWTESFRDDGLKTGTLLRSALAKSVTRMQEAVNIVRAQIQADAYKLVQLGVASRVDVEAEYAGSNRIAVQITLFGPSATQNVVNLVADRLANAWVWNS